MKTAFVAPAAAVVIAGGIAFFAGRMSALPEPDAAPPPRAPSAAARSAAPPTASTPTSRFPPLNAFPEVSFAQQGEDIIIKNIFAQLDLRDVTYIDIGAHEPIIGNNTYLFYALGAHGVLVEPNPPFVAKLRAERPRDVVIDKAIGIGGPTSASYYDFGGDGQINTFSKDQADRLAAAGTSWIRVIEMPMLDINTVLATHFGGGAPTLFSIDTEGLDLAILKRVDFNRFRPAVICAETLEIEGVRVIDEIARFLATKHYTVRGGTYVNTIFVADELLARKAAASQPDAGHDGGR